MTSRTEHSTTDEPTRGAAGRPGPVLRWRTVELITTVMIGVAFGVVFIGWGQLTTLLSPIFTAFKPLAGLMYGLYWIPAVLAAVIIRRPGAALLAELIAASVEPLLGGQWGLATLGSGLLQGLGVELGFLIFAYRRYTVLPAVIGGALAGLLETPYEWRSYYREWTAAWAGVYGVAMAISGAILAGVLGLALARALAATGALAPFPIGRERAEQRRI